MNINLSGRLKNGPRESKRGRRTPADLWKSESERGRGKNYEDELKVHSLGVQDECMHGTGTLKLVSVE